MDDANSVSPPGGGPARGSVRVVLADGSAEMRELLRAQLETLDGVRIVGVASDGTEAVAQAVRQVPDLMLLGIAMPTLDGLEATAEIRRRLPAAKIVVFSAYNAEQMADPARAAGADAYLEKAAPGDELVALIQRLFPDAQLSEIPPAALPVGAAADTAAETKDARRFRLLVDAIDEGVLVVDANRRVVCANSAAARILAVPTSRLLGRALPEFGLGLSADGPVTMAFGGRPRSTVPVQVRDAQGTPRWLVVSARPLLEPGKTVPTEVLVSFDDHTERRRTESHYQALAASLPDVAVVVVGDDLRITVATGADLTAAGWRAEDLLGRTPAEVLGADRARTITEAFRAALAGEHRVLQRVVGAAGRERIWHTEYTPVRDPAGTVIAAMAVSRDVTDQVRATGRFQLLFDEAPIGIALTGPDGRWLQVNPALCALVGHSAEDLLARDFQSITHPDDLADSVEQMRRLLAGEISSSRWTSATSIATATRSGPTSPPRSPVAATAVTAALSPRSKTSPNAGGSSTRCATARSATGASSNSPTRASGRSTPTRGPPSSTPGWPRCSAIPSKRCSAGTCPSSWTRTGGRSPPPASTCAGKANPSGSTSSSAAGTAARCGRTWRPARSWTTTAATRERSPSSPISPPARAPKPSWAGWPATTR